MTGPLTSAGYNLLLGASKLVGARTWPCFWRMWSSFDALAGRSDVTTRIHGHRVAVPVGYTYPLWSRRFVNYNAPLVEIAPEAFVTLGRPVRVVDVGAAVGDTALLLLSNLEDGALESVTCVEPDPRFAGLVIQNLAHEPRARVVRAMLSDGASTARNLVRTHPGTASAQGPGFTEARPLDEVVPAAVDVLKVDVDGMDGAVLAGASCLLGEHHPFVVFEWHPALYEVTGNDWRRPFAVLSHAGYGPLVWFDKFGVSVGLGGVDDARTMEARAAECLDRRRDEDWHYDVVAVPPGPSAHDQAARVAQLRFASGRPSRY
ncbi:MAG TPA: FkbM family methyltransferase [Acidimicrobiales bacterium]|nr:FkbM family methyltransferase [Acidimicrobiales bacterium]